MCIRLCWTHGLRQNVITARYDDSIATVFVCMINAMHLTEYLVMTMTICVERNNNSHTRARKSALVYDYLSEVGIHVLLPLIRH